MDKGYDTIWAELAAKIPWHTTYEELKKRDKIWTSMDTNGNGLITLDELEAGVKKLGLPALFDLKPVLQRAFNAAKNKLKAKKKKSYNLVYGLFILLQFRKVANRRATQNQWLL